MRLAALATAALTLAAPAQAEELRFTVSLRGLSAGVLSMSASEGNGSYKVAGEARPAGLARAFYAGDGRASVTGKVDGNRYRPGRYSETVTKKGEVREGTFTYSGGVAKVVKNPPDRKRRKYHADPADAKGSVDLLTTAYAILRERPAALACSLDLLSYDGREVTRIRMSGGKRDGARLLCPGTYSRIAGFSEKDMKEKVHWPFSVTYRIGADGTHVVERMDVPTTLGTVVFHRR
ncbi:DUF3108 domain-containing protein [Tropicimonas sp.]|uniref:DUF3108 domain-containing protein n=1 Tax=Tropicimonas sp. TaxID=2067044 RepID=UPI003A858769